MRVLNRPIETVSYSSGQRFSVDLPRNYGYRGIHIYFTCNITATETTAGSVLDSFPGSLVKNLQVVANGRDTLKYYPDMATLHRFNQMSYNVRPRISSKANTSAVATTDYLIHAYIPFAMWNAIRPKDTVYDSAGLATYQLIGDFGTGAADVFGGAYGGTVTVHSGSLYVATDEVLGITPDDEFMVYKDHFLTQDITAANTSLKIDLPTGNAYRGLLIKTVSDDVNVNTIMNSLKIKSGIEVFQQWDDFMNQSNTRLKNTMECPVASAILENVQTGYYYLDFCPDGRLVDALNTASFSSLELELNVANPGTTDKITVVPNELILPPKKQ